MTCGESRTTSRRDVSRFGVSRPLRPTNPARCVRSPARRRPGHRDRAFDRGVATARAMEAPEFRHGDDIVGPAGLRPRACRNIGGGRRRVRHHAGLRVEQIGGRGRRRFRGGPHPHRFGIPRGRRRRGHGGAAAVVGERKTDARCDACSDRQPDERAVLPDPAECESAGADGDEQDRRRDERGHPRLPLIAGGAWAGRPGH
jgi:hypothetical protein